MYPDGRVREEGRGRGGHRRRPPQGRRKGREEEGPRPWQGWDREAERGGGAYECCRDGYDDERERRRRRREKEETKGLLLAALVVVAGVVLCWD